MLSIFQAVLELTVAGTVVGLLLVLFKRICGLRLNARYHFMLWGIAVFRFILPYTFKSSFSIFNLGKLISSNVQTQTIESTAVAVNQASVVGAVVDTAAHKMSAMQIAGTVVSYIWVVVAIAVLAHLILNYIALVRQVKALPICKDKHVIGLFEAAKSQLGVKENIPIMYLSNVHSPSLMGLFKHRILISKRITRSLSDDELLYVFVHELSHLKRGDIIWSFIVKIICAVHWFNPFVWYMGNKIHQDIELACDAKALSILNDEDKYIDYGNTIIKLVAYFSSNKTIMGATAISGKKSNIKRRIQMVGSYRPMRFLNKITATLVAFLLAFVCLTSPTSPKAEGNEYNLPNIEQSIIEDTAQSTDVDLSGRTEEQNLQEDAEKIEEEQQNVDVPASTEKPVSTKAVTGNTNKTGAVRNNNVPTQGTPDKSVVSDNKATEENGGTVSRAEEPAQSVGDQTDKANLQLSGVRFDDDGAGAQKEEYLSIESITFE